MTAAPLEWKQLVTEVLQEAQIIPLWGNPPPFPWENFSEALGKTWNLPGLQIKCAKISWSKKEEALQGLGVNPLVVPLESSQLEGRAYWAISKEDMLLITQSVLQTSSLKETVEESLARGFYQFLLLQALHTFHETEGIPGLHVKIAEEHPLPSGTYLTCDIALNWSKGSLNGKLLLSRDFLSAFRNFFRVESSDFLATPAASRLSVALRVVIGHSTLPLSQWKQASAGDFLRLDSCSLSPVQKGGPKSGRARLALFETPLFDASIKNGKLSLLDYAFYQEESNAMNNEYIDEGEEQFPPEEEETGEMEGEFEEAPLEEAHEESELEEETPEAREPPPAPTGNEDMQHVVATSEIPITLIVEMGRLRMNLDKLLQLQPGNVLELAAYGDAGVHLCAGGKCVATGELVALGETVGVKIIKIGP